MFGITDLKLEPTVALQSVCFHYSFSEPGGYHINSFFRLSDGRSQLLQYESNLIETLKVLLISFLNL